MQILFYNFISLRLVMKNVFLKYMSALLAVWYCLSIIGFDVHSCTSTGSTFIASVLAGTTCDDIHPEHDCGGHKSCCCSHRCHEEMPSSKNVKEDESCCTNEIEVLQSEGVTMSNDDIYSPFCFAYAFVDVVNHYDALCRADMAVNLHYPDPGDFIVPDLQAVLSIWRI